MSQQQEPTPDKRCAVLDETGRPCGLWALPGSDRCRHHAEDNIGFSMTRLIDKGQFNAIIEKIADGDPEELTKGTQNYLDIITLVSDGHFPEAFKNDDQDKDSHPALRLAAIFYPLDAHVLCEFLGNLSVLIPIGPELEWTKAVNEITERNKLYGFSTPEGVESMLEYKVPVRPRRPSDLAKLEEINQPSRMPTQTHLNLQILEVMNSHPEGWIEVREVDGFALETRHGKAIIEGITLKGLEQILKFVSPEGLQYMSATLHHVMEKERKKHGHWPEYKDVTPTRISASDLLRTMGRKPKGNTFERDQQMRVRRFLLSMSRINLCDIQPTKQGKEALTVGPMLSVLDTEFEASLPLDNISGFQDEVISMTVMPGKVMWNFMRKGQPWLHPELLHYHPNNQKIEILVGFYLGQLAAVRRNKGNQEYITFRAIELAVGLDKLDSNPRRRLKRLETALHKLAKDGLIPGQKDVSGEIKAIIKPGQDVEKRSAVEAMREMMVKIMHPDALPNGYKPLPSASKRQKS